MFGAGLPITIGSLPLATVTGVTIQPVPGGMKQGKVHYIVDVTSGK